MVKLYFGLSTLRIRLMLITLATPGRENAEIRKGEKNTRVLLNSVHLQKIGNLNVTAKHYDGLRRRHDYLRIRTTRHKLESQRISN